MSSTLNSTPASSPPVVIGRFTAQLTPDFMAGATPDEAEIIFRLTGYLDRMDPKRLSEAARFLRLVGRCHQLGLLETPAFNNRWNFLFEKLRAARYRAARHHCCQRVLRFLTRQTRKADLVEAQR